MKREHIIQNLKFIGFTLIAGILLIVFLFTFESNPFKDSDFEIAITSNKEVLERDIYNFTKKTYNSDNFPILLTKISSSGKQGLISKSTVNYLDFKLIDGYKENVFNHCNKKLIEGGDDYNSYIISLQKLENSIGKNKDIDEYKRQINILKKLEYSTLKIIKQYFLKNIEYPFFTGYKEVNTTIYINYLKKPTGLNQLYKNSRIQKKLNIAIKNLKKLEIAYQNHFLDPYYMYDVNWSEY